MLEIDNLKTMETFLTFCHTKTVLMSDIDANLANFADKYNREKLMDVIDRAIAMKMDPDSHSIIKDISKWITNLKMKRTALKIGDLMQEE